MDESFVYSTQQEDARDLDDEGFVNLVEEAELAERKVTRIPLNTRYSNSWALNVWRDWAVWRNAQMEKEPKDRKYSRVPQLEVRRPEDDELGYWLSRFVLEIKKKDGSYYPPETLWSICCAIQRELREYKRDLHIFDEADPAFFDFYKHLDSRMKERYSTIRIIIR